MKVIINIGKKEHKITIRQAVEIYRAIHEQLYPQTKGK